MVMVVWVVAMVVSMLIRSNNNSPPRIPQMPSGFFSTFPATIGSAPPLQVPSGPTPTLDPPPFADPVPDYRNLPHWSRPMSFGWPTLVAIDAFDQVESTGWDDTIVLTGQILDVQDDLVGVTLASVDLDGWAALWNYSFVGSYSNDDWARAFVDPWGIVVETHFNGVTRIQVMDALSGTVFATADLGEYSDVRQVVSGMIVVEDQTDYCIRSVRAPQTCRQQFNGSFLSASLDFQPVIGAGRWINTSHGVFDLTTGKPAKFGADAHGISPDETEVRYVADQPDRVFRVECIHDPGTVHSTCTYQPWDPDGNRALGQIVKADLVTMSGDRSAFVAIDVVDDLSVQPVLYSWPAADVVWQDDAIKCVYASFCATASMTAAITGRTYMMSAIGKVGLILDIATGAIIKVDEPDVLPSGPLWAFGGDQVVYLGIGYALVAYDGASGNFDKLWTLRSDDRMSLITGAGHHVIGIDDARGMLWVLQP